MLYTSNIILSTVGIYLIVNTFRRFEKRNTWLTTFAVEKPVIARILGFSLLLFAFALLLFNNDFWTSIFMWFNVITLLLMLIILLNPLSKIKIQGAFILWGIILILEIILTYAR